MSNEWQPLLFFPGDLGFTYIMRTWNNKSLRPFPLEGLYLFPEEFIFTWRLFHAHKFNQFKSLVGLRDLADPDFS